MKYSNEERAFSATEMIAVLAILGIAMAILLPRVVGNHDQANSAGCLVNKGEIELQAELWKANTGNWPAADLSDIGSDLHYFPEGLPTCPLDGTTYTIDSATGFVVGHNH